MDPDAFTAALLKWDPRVAVPPPPQQPQLQPNRLLEALAPLPTPSAAAASAVRPRENLGGLEDLFQAYGIRYYTGAKIAELGFTVSTLVNMKEEELDDMMNSLSHIFRWELLVGERYGIKAAVRSERRRLQDLEESRRRLHQQHHHHGISSFSAAAAADHGTTTTNNNLDQLSQEGLSEEHVQVQVQQQQQLHEMEAEGSGGGARWDAMSAIASEEQRKKQRRRKGDRHHHERHHHPHHHHHHHHDGNGVVMYRRRMGNEDEEDEEEMEEEEMEEMEERGGERQREHPFIVTEPGEVARGKKNGLDYLFHLYEQCREFLVQVQNLSRERGEKCPTKVTNQVFRYAKKAGANYINKPKMRHYVHCYALHCLDEDASNSLRRSFKERGENVGAWRQACYKPLVAIAARQAWDIDAIFNSHPRLSVWYVPTKLRQLCHAERSCAAANNNISSVSAAGHRLHF